MSEEEYIRNRLDQININSHYGLMIDTEITKLVRDHMKEKEDNKMKATSVQNIKNIKDICFDVSNDPIERESKLTIIASTDDDIFAFEFEGLDILQCCKRAGLFTGWEKDQKIRELEKELNDWKKEAADCLKLRDEAQKEAYKLKKENEMLKDRHTLTKAANEKIKENAAKLIKENKELQSKYDLEKAANEASHKFFKQYAGKGTEIEFNYAIGDDDETTYVIVDKEEYKALKNIQNMAAERRFNEELHNFEVNNKKYDGKIMEEILKRNSGRYPWDEEPADNVNHPSHYNGRYECIDVMQDVFGDEATDNFCLCNAFKYIWRARKKNGLEDVKKAVWYLNKYIEEAEKDGVQKGEQV